MPLEMQQRRRPSQPRIVKVVCQQKGLIEVMQRRLMLLTFHEEVTSELIEVFVFGIQFDRTIIVAVGLLEVSQLRVCKRSIDVMRRILWLLGDQCGLLINRCLRVFTDSMQQSNLLAWLIPLRSQLACLLPYRTRTCDKGVNS